ncbi:TraR/DksA C4-type zinc finger protein [Persephonella sp. KM09-Lau-8]|uniref:TraR/DksA family transcriptional regulator n=1 Tax=Persephonella sp. KM09-Lau-8 TaxID=1158345 RepID=UPI000497F148|nr:TraR/DksA C4-type zinc finger protein [Persephonella sp. KM09-Lau-8]
MAVSPYVADKKKLEKFRKLLLQEKKRILDRILQKEDIIKKMTEEGLTIPEELDDYARIDYTEFILSELEDIEVEILQEIDKALQRMEEGTYGLCEVCGKPIEEKRLEALPWTTLCIEHAAEAEKTRDLIDHRYTVYLRESLIPYYEPLEEDVKEEGEDK